MKQILAKTCARFITGLSLLLLALASLAPAPGSAAFQASVDGRLKPADKVRMIQSKDSSNKPFFRIQLSSPEGIPKLKSPANSIEILEGEHTYRPFYVHLGDETLAVRGSASTSKRFAMLVMDLSGSMLERLASGQTKFEAAKAAAKQFLNGFQPGIDNVAVVPFESRQVVPRIRQAVFADNLASVQAQIDNLSQPDRKADTGLYTAVETALSVLDEKKKEDVSRSAMLLVLTDGKNDVHPERGDDPDLLKDGDLPKVVSRARALGFTVVTIGFGDTPQSLDSVALRQIASPDHYWSASNLQSLEQIFRAEKEALINQFDVTFVTDRSDNRTLAGADIHFRVRMRTDDRRVFESDPIPFLTPQTSPPPFEGKLTADEEEAWIRQSTVSRVDPSKETSFADLLLSRLAIMVGLGSILASCWFGLPRMFWPESYLRSLAAKYTRVPNIPGVRPPLGSLPNVPRPNIPVRPSVKPPAGSAPARKADPAATMSESKVTIRPQRPAPPGGTPKANPQVRRAADDTMVTGAQGPGETDPWGFDPPPKAPPKR